MATKTADGVEMVIGQRLYGWIKLDGGSVCTEWDVVAATDGARSVGETMMLRPALNPDPVIARFQSRQTGLIGGLSKLLFASRENYDASQRAHHAAAAARRLVRDAQRAEQDNRRARYQAMCGRLYDEAMAVAVDADDMDVVEHHCQGHADRLREFIAARKVASDRIVIRET
jgi:hypothetical protein